MKKKKYIISFDIGTDSIGTAVIDLDGNPVRMNNKPGLSSYIYDKGETANSTAVMRRNRRRLNHKRHLVEMLQEILKIDDEFKNRLKESSLYDEDRVLSSRSEKNIYSKGGYSLFNGDSIVVNGNTIADYTDQKYHKDFPTIHHLIYDLKNKKEQYDIRLVYLALHNLLKRRGHFLIEGELNLNSDSSKYEYLKNIQLSYKDVHDVELSDNQFKMLEELNGRFDIVQVIKKAEMTATQIKRIIGVESDKKINLLDENFEDEIKSFELNSAQYELFKNIKLYAESVKLKSFLGDYKSICDRKVDIYNQHKNHLIILKELIKSSNNEKIYKEMFKCGDCWYKQYLKHYNNFDKKNKLLKGLVDILDSLKKENLDSNLFIKKEEDFVKNFIIVDGKNRTIAEHFLPRQKIKENSLLPNQLFKNEFYEIIDNQKKYHNWTNQEVDDLKYLIDFKIGYFVGPITRNQTYSKFSWVIFKEGRDDKPTALNYKDIIDFEKTELRFIQRMLKKCTYLKGENPVLPRQSILYSEVALLNELNDLSIYNTSGELIVLNRKMKEKIIDDLFSRQVNVTQKSFIKFMNDNFMHIGEVETVIGMSDNQFTNNLYAKINIKNILKESYTEELAEEIIRILLVFEDRKKKEELLLKLDESLKENLSRLSSLKITGWGNLSHHLLSMKVHYGEKTCSIRDRLYDSNNNIQQILSEEPFRNYILEYNKKYATTIIGDPHSKSNREILKDIIDDLYASPAVKKAVKNTFDIYREVIKKMDGQLPEYIVIEMARGKEKSGRTVPKYQQINSIYNQEKNKELKDVKKELKYFEKNDMRLKEELYFRQLGRCMYTETKLVFENLERYEIDHILPRSIIKDDSIDNLVLVLSKANQNKAAMPIFKYISTTDVDKERLLNYWNKLYKMKLISTKKYKNLQIQEFNDDVISGFISRQLVETRQSTKIVSDIFESFFGFDRSKIYSISAKTVSEIRNHSELKLFKNRDINHYHHAYDAYLSGLIAIMKIKKNINYIMQNKKEELMDEALKFIKESNNVNYKNTQSFVMSLFLKSTPKWNFKDIKEKMFKYYVNRHYYLSIEGKSPNEELFNQTIKSAVNKDDKDSNDKKIPLKKGLSTKKYGYYTSQNGHSLLYFSFNNIENRKSFSKLAKTIHSGVIYISSLQYLKYKKLYNIDNEIMKEIYLDYCKEKVKKGISIEEQEYIIKNSTLIPGKLKSSVIIELENHKSHLVQIVSGKEFSILKNYIPNIKSKYDFTIAIEIINSLSKSDEIFMKKFLDDKNRKVRTKNFHVLRLLVENLEQELSSIWYFDKHKEYLDRLKQWLKSWNNDYQWISNKILDIKLDVLNAIRIVTGSEYIKEESSGKLVESRKFRNNNVNILSNKRIDAFSIIHQSKSGFFRKKVRFIVNNKGKK